MDKIRYFRDLAPNLFTFIHWTYASQYLKTCIILPSIVKKAHLLLTMNTEKLEHEYEIKPLTETFRDRHN